ncbi:hypothetical protein [Mycetocola spongiae]|uniref:hypothetical protein n=1 Tax=Mycetocola spongiae TaxID=2859226 RepID=UPI001CF2152A|nr:hypothetical protein [Mycetocola spongiae]UCR90208.1 hypothetical protein KXZ72_06000 [Mycetocola spongiae]
MTLPRFAPLGPEADPAPAAEGRPGKPSPAANPRLSAEAALPQIIRVPNRIGRIPPEVPGPGTRALAEWAATLPGPAPEEA